MPQPPVPITLVMQRGPHPSRSFALEKDQLTLGRDASVDIVIDDREVSRFHARLTRRGSQWIVEDIGSSNGTFVNGQRISGPVALAPGAQLGLGPDVVLGVQSSGPAYAAAPQPRGGRRLGWGVIGAVVVLAAFLLIGGGAAVYFLLVNPPSVSLPSLELSGMAALGEGPAVTVQEPAAGARIGQGETVLVFATARDAQKVTRLDLWINDTLVTQQASPAPEGVTPLSLIYRWTPTEAGIHYLLVRAYDSTGVTGESPLVAVTVSGDPAPPEQALYVTQPGDTVDSLAAQMGVTVQDVQAANPSMGEQIAPGQAVMLPAPPSAPASQPGVAPAPPPAKAGGAAGAAGGGPAALGPPPPPPPNSSLIAPTLIGLQAADCQVTITWQDNTEGEDGFGILRAALGMPGFQLLQPAIGKVEGKGKSQQFIDSVPGPGSYVYTVMAGAYTGAEARSNPHTIVVPPTAKCVEAPGYKQVMFQPLQVQAGKYSSLNMYFDVGSHIYRRAPAVGGLTPGDWSGHTQMVPVYLKPGDPLVLTVGGEAHANKGSYYLGAFSHTFSQAELTSDRQWQDKVAATGLDVTYRLWLQHVMWGQAVNSLMAPPGNLHLAATAAELDMLPGCAPGKCDPKAARSLVWEWPGNPAQADGYLLLRTYTCGGKETYATDVIVGVTHKGRIVPAGTEPAGCAASYQVRAFGPAGVSSPSSALPAPAAGGGAAVVALAFDEFGVNGVLAGQSVVKLAFNANEQLIKSQSVALPAVGAAPGSQALDISRQFMDGKAPNNRVWVGLSAEDSLQIGFIAQVGDQSCGAQEILSLKPGETWDQYIGHEVTMMSPDGKCEAVARIGQSSHPLSAGDDPPKVSADIDVDSPFVVGKDVYTTLRNVGPDQLTDQHHIQVEGWWRLYDRLGGSDGGFVGSLGDEMLESQQTVAWPADSDRLVLKVGSTDSIHYLKGVDAEDKIQFRVIVNAVDFVDVFSWNSDLSMYVSVTPLGFACSKNEDCASGYCADGMRCAPEDGQGVQGDYCHHDNQCASGLCVCPNGWESGTAGFCKGWRQFAPLLGEGGRCSEQSENGAGCTENQDCVSGYCADGKICAPKDGAGESGDYCHHDNQCKTGLCLCPDGWEGGSGFCKGWQGFSATGSHGTCTKSLPEGATCSENRDCGSGYCADGKKCAPKDGTGGEGDYCHHDNQCFSGMCDCPSTDMRVMGAKSFCPDWESFSSTYHGVCLAKGENGDSCTRSEQCESGYCADGKKCAPKDGTGGEGDYCHHNNHCQTRVCDCPEGTDLFGFCKGWEDFTTTDHATCQVY